MNLARRTGCIGGIAAIVLARVHRPAHAQGVQVVASHPATDAMLDRGAAEFFVRFHTPVDHYRSRLVLLRDGQTLHQLHPRLNTAPEVLFAMAPVLESGRYELRWEVVTIEGNLSSEGSIPFAVRP